MVTSEKHASSKRDGNEVCRAVLPRGAMQQMMLAMREKVRMHNNLGQFVNGRVE